MSSVILYYFFFFFFLPEFKSILCMVYTRSDTRLYSQLGLEHINKAGWPNGKALDYESRDCRFDPCVGQSFCFLSFWCWK